MTSGQGSDGSSLHMRTCRMAQPKPAVPSPLSPASLARGADRLGAAARNAVEVARLGGLETDEESSPYDVVHHDRIYRLRRYFPELAMTHAGTLRPALILVPPMMLTAEVWDVSTAISGVRLLAEAGIDPWVVDFGAPEHEAGGLERTLTDHVVAVSDAVERVREVVGADVHLGGYSQGGMFCYQTAALRRSAGIASLVTFGSPVDTLGMIPFGLPDELVTRGLSFLAEQLIADRHLPAWASRTGFRLLDPVKSIRQRFDFLRQLHDRESLLPREKQRRFLMQEGWVAWPGPALAELVQQIVAHNRMLSGGFVIEGRTVTLADIDCPILCFVGEKDDIAPPPVVRAVRRAAPLADAWERSLPAGHFGLVVGSTAVDQAWPVVSQWLQWRAGAGPRPSSIRPIPELPASVEPAELRPLGPADGAALAANLSIAALRGAARAATRATRTVESMARNVTTTLPRLVRLDRVGPTTRVSLGLLLDEQAGRGPDATFFLFEDRGHSYGDAKRRIDNIVRGLISVGVHQGEHIGVLMDMRPSALAVVAALSRMGAVAVMLRPDGPLAREAELGGIRRLIADPEHAEAAARLDGIETMVLGGGGEPRELGFGLTDLEQIDPDDVPVPAWYRPNPGRARDLAYICFTGGGAATKANHITNRRWALSAFGTASAAALSGADTVYSVTPIHHPSGLLTSIGGAVAGGARLAVATTFDPATFWDEVRRYGVTVVSYTWTLAHDLVNAPPSPLERHHPVRLFMGSGMPKGLWRRILDRFAPARVLEFYASTEGRAVLANLGGGKPGAKGRQLPGSADSKIAAYDPDNDRLEAGADGFAVECRPGKVGLLLARADHDLAASHATPLRGVFRRDDAWLSTGDLFRIDADGDHWLVGAVDELIDTRFGKVGPRPVEDALADLAGVDLVTVYGVPQPDGPGLLVAAVTQQPGATIKLRDLDELVGQLPDWQRPDIVRVVAAIPTTTWFRLRNDSLCAEGVVAARAGHPAWILGRATGRYERITASMRNRLRS
jgi:putative long chain acyl-CoA synthase